MNADPARHIVISANPKSGAKSGLEKAHRLKDLLANEGWKVDLTTDLDHMQQIVEGSHQRGELRTVVSAGGDGTVSAVLNRIPSRIPLTIFPLGSENLLAQEFKLPREPSGVIPLVQKMATRQLDLFWANGTVFLLMASVGFDAQVVRMVHESRRSHITRWAYRLAVLKAIQSYRWPTLSIEGNFQGRWESLGTCHWLFAFNVPRYAAGIHIIDDALVDDGLLDVGMLTGGNAMIGLWNYLRVALGTHRRSSRWRECRVNALRVVSSQGQGGYQLDGDWGGPLPLEIVHTGTKATLVVPD